MTLTEKACTKCTTTKPVSDFFRSTGHRTGFTSWCKECYRLKKRTKGPSRLHSKRFRHEDGFWLCMLCQEHRPRGMFPSDTQGRPLKGCVDCRVAAKQKTCNRCKITKPAEAFHRCSRNLGGLQAYCKECGVTIRRDNWSTLSDEERKRRRREGRARYDARFPDAHTRSRLKRQFGISYDDYMTLRARQNDACGICGVHQHDLQYRLAVDHCHTTGQIRGLLCKHCNLGIGQLGDTAEALRNALRYVENALLEVAQ